ncbi:MAG: phosphate starvation protein PhoH [Candidatus Neomarinimicrobiota bacterium]|nr:MAG: phosphate starvation protein PhoH [Candidatus Neomarinimicrobiota bacterium]
MINRILEKIIDIKSLDLVSILGVADCNLKLIQSVIPVSIIARGHKIKITGNKSNVDKVNQIFYEMIETLNSKGGLEKSDVKNLISMVKVKDNYDNKQEINSHYIICYAKKGTVTPKTDGQIRYCKTVNNNDVVFCNGPAGTGKTFLAVCFAVSALEHNLIDKIVLCRPAVEAGENLGFLPGDLKDKVDPYLAPLYDALNILYDEKKLFKLLETKIIEIVPLAYMRGRTLDNSFMILDEAQNSTITQMKMFLTRLGVGSKSIITGDVTQIDLQSKKESGLVQVAKVLKGIKGIGFANLNQNDVVRHPLVKKIIEAYDRL